MVAEIGPEGRYLIGHARARSRADELERLLRAAGVTGAIDQAEMGAALAAHAGPGCVAVAGRKPRRD